MKPQSLIPEALVGPANLMAVLAAATQMAYQEVDAGWLHEGFARQLENLLEEFQASYREAWIDAIRPAEGPIRVSLPDAVPAG